MSDLLPAVQDERLGRPSASAMILYDKCRGAYLLNKQVPASERFRTKDSDRGDRIHLANETSDVSGLELAEADLVELIRIREQDIFAQWCDECEITDAEIIRERRLWMTDGAQNLCSGKLDFLAISPSKRKALILDAKSGRKAVVPSPRNWQLRTQLVLAAENFGVRHGRVGIVQPLSKTQPLTDYGHDDIYGPNGAYQQLLDRLQEISQPDAKRTPGEHCGLCDARHICPEAKGYTSALTQMENMRWSVIPVEKRVELWEKAKLAKKIAAHIEENVKAELTANPDAYKGYLVKQPDQNPRVITDVTKAYEAMTKAFPSMPPEEVTAEFNKLVEMSVGGLETLYRERNGGTKKAATEWVNRALADCMTTKPKAGSVVKVKEEE